MGGWVKLKKEKSWKKSLFEADLRQGRGLPLRRNVTLKIQPEIQSVNYIKPYLFISGLVKVQKSNWEFGAKLENYLDFQSSLTKISIQIWGINPKMNG